MSLLSLNLVLLEVNCPVYVLFQGTHQIPLAVVFNPLHADSVMMLCGVH